MHARIASALAAALMLVACGPDGDKNSLTNSDPNLRTIDAGPEDTGSTDPDTGTTRPDMGTNEPDGGGGTNSLNSVAGDPGGCGDEILADVTLDIDNGRSGQLYTRAAWDGQGVWVVYAKTLSDEDFAPEELFATRVACDGTVSEPLQISLGNGNRNYGPVLDSNYDTTHVVWVEQEVGGGAVTLRLQVLSRDGAAVLAEPLDVTPVGGEGPISALSWEPSVGVFDDGTGVVAVATASEEFQVALQRYDSNGAVGNAIVPYTEKGVDQRRPSVAAAEDGTIYVSWTRYKAADSDAGTPEEPERVVFTSIPAGANMAFPMIPVVAKPLAETNPISRYAREPGPNGEYFLVFQVTNSMQSDILVRNGSDFESAQTTSMGTARFNNFRPSVAGGTNRGVIAWYRYPESPLRNDVMVQPFGEGGGLEPGTEMVIETNAPGIPPYGPDVTWAGGDAYFVAWSEGDSGPESRAKGRFIVFE